MYESILLEETLYYEYTYKMSLVISQSAGVQVP